MVVVITPPDTHAGFARDALEHGKHVVCEKPVGMHRDEAEAVFELAAGSGLHVLAAPFVHLSPTFRELWTRVNRGEIGSVHSARAMYGNAGVTWSSWYHEAGVGPLAELGVYNLKSLTSLLGRSGRSSPPMPSRSRCVRPVVAASITPIPTWCTRCSATRAGRSRR